MNLEDILKTGNLKDESLNNNFYSEISSALDYLHTRNIVHGFLHLNSIYITDRKNQKLSVKLSGYGLPFVKLT